MSKISIAAAVFSDVFERPANFESIEDRLADHRIVYLLKELGVSCGEYAFRWNKGPYSQALQNVLVSDNIGAPNWVQFSEPGRAALDKVKEMFQEDHAGYSDQKWLDALSSILFLRKHSLKGSGDIILDLETRKSYLDKHELNQKASEVLDRYFNPDDPL